MSNILALTFAMKLEPRVTTTQLTSLQDAILEWLLAAEKPVSTKELLESHAPELGNVGGEHFRRAVWNLVDSGKARFDGDWRLVANNGSQP